VAGKKEGEKGEKGPTAPRTGGREGRGSRLVYISYAGGEGKEGEEKRETSYFYWDRKEKKKSPSSLTRLQYVIGIGEEGRKRKGGATFPPSSKKKGGREKRTAFLFSPGETPGYREGRGGEGGSVEVPVSKGRGGEGGTSFMFSIVDSERKRKRRPI